MSVSGLQGDEGIYYCVHGTQPYAHCVKCDQERRDREAHEMLRRSFDRLADVLDRLEKKL